MSNNLWFNLRVHLFLNFHWGSLIILILKIEILFSELFLCQFFLSSKFRYERILCSIKEQFWLNHSLSFKGFEFSRRSSNPRSPSKSFYLIKLLLIIIHSKRYIESILIVHEDVMPVWSAEWFPLEGKHVVYRLIFRISK